MENINEWVEMRHKEILQTLKEEFDFNISGFEFKRETDSLGNRHYCIMDVHYGDNVRTGSMVVIDLGDGQYEIDRVNAEPLGDWDEF